ncbi:MAG: porphobilinogen synthase [Candidatus Omnitrophica bacterium]|nr:porphobilinogen synthase [Candidatus Omnitrophota bacterium]
MPTEKRTADISGPFSGRYPATRLRRLRRTPALRRLVQESAWSAGNLVLPCFVKEGLAQPEPIPSMPGVVRHSLKSLASAAKEAQALGLGGVLLFGLPRRKDAQGRGADAADGIVQQGVRAIKRAAPGLAVMTDVCLCEYTDHGHCGILRGRSVANDATLKRLAAIAVSQARAGADLVAPSAMMDGQVRAIRRALDAAGFADTPIMAYAAKYCSAFYGPFREAAASAPAFGDRRGYQMSPANREEALREVALDIEEGADLVMVKPASAYLDVIRAVKERFHWPTACYQVSGEYAMLKAAAARGWVDEARATDELLTAMRRAGADLLITYSAVTVARRLSTTRTTGRQ